MQTTTRCLKILAAMGIWLAALLSVNCAVAQTIYGVGENNSSGVYDMLFSVNPNSGAATRVCNTTLLSFPTAAMGVSNLGNGLLYYVEQNVANPRINSFDPSTCTNGTPVATVLPISIIRATACPDGRFYAMSNTTSFFEIVPSTGAISRTLTWTGLPTGGSGDFACVSNGDLYILAQNGGKNYELYYASNASFQGVATGSNVAATLQGTLSSGGAPNGLSEAPTGLAGCAAAPNPCLVVSTGTTDRTWRINALTGASVNAGTTGATLVDLSRNFTVNASATKSASPTIALQGQTVTYSINVSNSGPGVLGAVNVTDNFQAGAFSSVAWTCGVINPGTAGNLMTTACAAASGSGNINQTASLSVNGQVQYNVTGVLNSAFTGTITNVATAIASANYVDLTPTNNFSTVTSTVTPAANLSVSKTNGTNTVVAGGSTSYTITVANQGPAAAPGALVQDNASAGLNCTTVTCSSTAVNMCPAASFAFSSLSAGITISPSFPAGSTATLVVTCGVTATGQ
jgi:uncharacterized repeat protein (TIGR01451 family)